MTMAMFKNIENIPLSPSTIPAKKPKKLGRWERLVQWCKDHFTASHVVVRTMKDHPERPFYLCMGYAPVTSWEPEYHRAVVTWKWNAQRIADLHTYQSGELYTFTVVRQSELPVIVSL